MRRKLAYVILVPLAWVFCFALSGCGGGGNSAPNSFTDPSSVTVTVSSPSSTVLLGNTIGFTASVSGTSNAAVTWTVSGIAGGNATVGTINSNGMYTAPKDLPSPTSIVVGATSQAAPSKSATTPVIVTSDVVVGLITNPFGATSVPL